MIRTNFYLSARQVDRLKAEAGRTGVTASELIRRAVDEWIAKLPAEKPGKGAKRGQKA